MNARRFVDYRLGAGIVGGGVLLASYVFCLCMYPYAIQGFILKNISPALFIAITFTYIVLGIGIGWCIRSFFGRRTMAWLTVTETQIIWRCPFYRSAKINLADCMYVGIEDMANHQVLMPVIRGDELSFIYLSTYPFPTQFKHKADLVKCTRKLIIFAYSDKLCATLIEILPEDKTKYLVSFYNRMQASDREIKAERQKKRKKSKKK